MDIRVSGVVKRHEIGQEEWGADWLLTRGIDQILDVSTRVQIRSSKTTVAVDDAEVAAWATRIPVDRVRCNRHAETEAAAVNVKVPSDRHRLRRRHARCET